MTTGMGEFQVFANRVPCGFWNSKDIRLHKDLRHRTKISKPMPVCFSTGFYAF